ncbi:carbamoyl-phosphate synthase small chain [Clostridia bacterium]|nr:carbamoyl-phosphate synthase small chain [Clostridia bacterium]
MSNAAYLVLENGKIFKGKAFGASIPIGGVVGEIVFTTGMTGYLETLTDKSYFGQIVTQTFPLIGNYGVIPSDFESDGVALSAYIVRSWCQTPSNFRSTGDLDTFLKSEGIPGLFNIDTRALTKIIRERGVMNGVLTEDPANVDFDALKAYRAKDAVKRVTRKSILHDGTAIGGAVKIALMDYGLKENIYRELVNRGADVYVLPAETPFGEIKSLGVDGVTLSNGPGDPTDNAYSIGVVKRILEEKIPCFGICLGHQLMANAAGFKTEKMKYGHRGANQSVKNAETGGVFITSQNHGYAVVNESIDKNIAAPLFINVNDGTNEGIRYKNAPAFSVQFHPEACGGPLDTGFLFDTFLATVRENRESVLKESAFNGGK